MSPKTSDESTEGLRAATEFFAQLLREPGNLTAVHSDLVRLAKDRGFECTVEDLTQALQELWKSTRVPYSERPGF